jgi:hypothetical protein
MLVHGYSRVVLEILKLAASNRKLFRVLCTGTLPWSFSCSVIECTSSLSGSEMQYDLFRAQKIGAVEGWGTIIILA